VLEKKYKVYTGKLVAIVLVKEEKIRSNEPSESGVSSWGSRHSFSDTVNKDGIFLGLLYEGVGGAPLI